jgi:hypothetical protein
VRKTDSCWIWESAFGTRGYGVFWLGGKKRSAYAHRVALELSGREIPKGMLVMHSCDNPACVNPSHLSAGTPADNTQDAASKKRMAWGARNSGAKLTEEQAREIKNSTLPTRVLAKRYGMERHSISGIRRGYTWRHL